MPAGESNIVGVSRRFTVVKLIPIVRWKDLVREVGHTALLCREASSVTRCTLPPAVCQLPVYCWMGREVAFRTRNEPGYRT